MRQQNSGTARLFNGKLPAWKGYRYAQCPSCPAPTGCRERYPAFYSGCLVCYGTTRRLQGATNVRQGDCTGILVEHKNINALTCSHQRHKPKKFFIKVLCGSGKMMWGVMPYAERNLKIPLILLGFTIWPKWLFVFLLILQEAPLCIFSAEKHPVTVAVL